MQLILTSELQLDFPDVLDMELRKCEDNLTLRIWVFGELQKEEVEELQTNHMKGLSYD